MGVNGVAALWGFAEATLFFLVPDVLLTMMAVSSLRKALMASVFALLGALAGGALMYEWGARDHETVLATLDRLPAIGPDILSGVATELRTYGLFAPFFGPIKGVPYKIYAAQAAEHGIGLGSFLLISIPARLIRFVLLSLMTWLLSRTVWASWKPRSKVILLGIGWAAFYTGYFMLMPN